MIVMPPESIMEVYHWGVGWRDQYGLSEDYGGHQMRFLTSDHDTVERTYEFWRSNDDGTPVFTYANDSTSPRHYQFQLYNDSDDDFTWDKDGRGLSGFVYYRIIDNA